jgi:hypothetical protein
MMFFKGFASFSGRPASPKLLFNEAHRAEIEGTFSISLCVFPVTALEN